MLEIKTVKNEETLKQTVEITPGSVSITPENLTKLAKDLGVGVGVADNTTITSILANRPFTSDLTDGVLRAKK